MLTATISHDMRTPLNAIISVSKNLIHSQQQRLNNMQNFESYLSIVTNSALLLSFLVNDLTDLFKIRIGKFVPNEQEVDIKSLIYEVFDIFSIQSREKGLDLKLICNESVPKQLRLDSTRFKQVLVNLLGNSLKFTFRGSIRVLMRYDRIEDELHVTVKDTGIGIQEAERKKILEMFCRLENSLTTSTSGIGLGLSICNQIVTALGGKLIINPTIPVST